MVHRSLSAVVAVSITLLGALPAWGAEGSRFREAVRGDAGVIATESPAATEVGLAVLDAGGNAIDAAIATVFAINVARPQSCGIGGGGFLVYREANGDVHALDFREEAPAAITADSFGGAGIHRAFTGHRTIGVPGTLAGLVAMNERFATMPLADLIAPAETLARDGVEVTDSLSSAMAAAAPRLRLFPAAAEQFLVGGVAPYPPGSTLVQPDLADSLALIADEGLDAFYRGAIADLIIADMEDNAGAYPGDDGLMTKADLAAYEAVWREPVSTTYRGFEVFGMPPPTSGGVAMMEILNILEGFDVPAAGQSSADHLHLVAEAQKIAWADRNQYLADPDVVDVPTDILISKAYAEQRRQEIELDTAKSYQPGEVGAADLRARPAGLDNNPRGSTTSFSIIDAAGNALALTCTIEQAFGSAVVAPGTGFLLNNELTDFSGAGSANEPGPGKRPRSSISPTIVVKDGQPVLAVGGAGGATIIMGSVLAVEYLIDFGLDPARAIDAERLDDQTGVMSLENVRVSPAVQADLADRGHQIQPNGEYGVVPRVQAAGVDLLTGDRLAVSDPRTDWAAAAQDGGGAPRDDPGDAGPTDPAPTPEQPPLPTTGGGAVAFALLALTGAAVGRGRPNRV